MMSKHERHEIGQMLQADMTHLFRRNQTTSILLLSISTFPTDPQRNVRWEGERGKKNKQSDKYLYICYSLDDPTGAPNNKRKKTTATSCKTSEKTLAYYVYRGGERKQEEMKSWG